MRRWRLVSGGTVVVGIVMACGGLGGSGSDADFDDVEAALEAQAGAQDAQAQPGADVDDEVDGERVGATPLGTEDATDAGAAEGKPTKDDDTGREEVKVAVPAPAPAPRPSGRRGPTKTIRRAPK